MGGVPRALFAPLLCKGPTADIRQKGPTGAALFWIHDANDDVRVGVDSDPCRDGTHRTWQPLRRQVRSGKHFEAPRSLSVLQ